MSLSFLKSVIPSMVSILLGYKGDLPRLECNQDKGSKTYADFARSFNASFKG